MDQVSWNFINDHSVRVQSGRTEVREVEMTTIAGEPVKTERVQVVHFREPDELLSIQWLKYQARTTNFGNIALLITMLYVSLGVKATVNRLEAQNVQSAQSIDTATNLVHEQELRL